MADTVPAPVRLIRRSDNPAFPTVGPFTDASFGLPFSETGRHYYGSHLPQDFVDFSFALTSDDGPLAIVEVDSWVPGELGRFGMPIEIWRRRGLSPMTRRLIARDAIRELVRIGRATARAVKLRTGDRLDPLGVYAARLAEIGAQPAASLRALMDLALDDDTLIQDMRRRNRQHVRWGRDTLVIETVDAQQPSREAFDRYRLLHAEVAGRVTRPIESWDAMFALIVAGFGDLILTHLDQTLVGGTLILDDDHSAYYASGAHRRDRFDKPLSHYPMLLAASRARARGRRIFDIGETWGGTLDMDDLKQRSIGRFKAGLSGTADVSMVWTVPPSPA